jgi:anti-sigma factor RsiW
VKESKFIELLNLYIDQQISPEEAAALEREILQDAQRRRIYHQYCRMHRACSLVFENFRSQAEPATAETVRQAGEMVEFGAKPRRFSWGYYVAGLAAAACVALVALQVFVRPAAPAAKDATVARPTAVSTGATPAALVPVRVDAPAPAFVAPRLVLSSPTGSQSPASLVIVAERNPSFPPPTARVAPRSLRPSIEQFVFEQPASGNDNPPVLRIRQTTDAQAEMTAYQFQR